MAEPIPADGPLLLVVEDDLLVRMTLVDALSDDGFQVLEAEDAAQALDLVCCWPAIAAMLTDINLPGGADGFALARAVRVVRPGLPVVYASGRHSAMQDDKAVQGACFLAKPFIPSLAANTLRDLIRAGAMPSAAVAIPPWPIAPTRQSG